MVDTLIRRTRSGAYEVEGLFERSLLTEANASVCENQRKNRPQRCRRLWQGRRVREERSDGKAIAARLRRSRHTQPRRMPLRVRI